MYLADMGTTMDWQFTHRSAFVRGGVGLIFTEAAVERRGCITSRYLGIWADEQREALKLAAKFF